MDHRTRVWNALNMAPVDRVPFDMFDEAGYLFRAGRYDPGQRLFLSLDQQVAARVRFQQEFDTDLIFDAPVIARGEVPYSVRLAPPYAERYRLLLALFPCVGAVWHPWPAHVEPYPGIDPGVDERIELVFEWQNGLSRTLTLDVATGTVAGYAGLVTSREEWTLWQEAYLPSLSAFDYTYLDAVKRATRGEVALYGTIIGPCSMFQTFFGIEESIVLLYEEPEFAGKAMDWLTDVAIQSARDMVRHGIDVVRIGEAGVSLFSPALYRQHSLPRHVRLYRAIRQAGGTAILHVCGECDALLEPIAEAGTPALETLTPPPLGDADLADAKRRIGGRVCLKGNLDPVHVVAKLSPHEVAAATRRCLEIGSPGSGYILSVADCLVAGTPIENLRAIADVVHSFRPA